MGSSSSSPLSSLSSPAQLSCCQREGVEYVHNAQLDQNPVFSPIVEKIKQYEYHPPRIWGRFSILQNLFGVLFRSSPNLDFDREIITVDEEGGTIALDWWNGDTASCSDDDSPLLVLFHGLTGGSHERYGIEEHMGTLVGNLDLYRTYDMSFLQHWNRCTLRGGVVVNFRGCAGTTLTSPKAYSAAEYGDVGSAVEHIRKRFPHRRLVAAGFSLGSVVLVRYLSEVEDNCPFEAALSVSNPLDMQLSCDTLRQFPNYQLYYRRMGSSLRRLATENWEMFQKIPRIDSNRTLSAADVYEFDEYCTRRAYGYPSVEAYYEDCSSIRRLSKVRIPLLVLNSKDDSFAPIPVDSIAEQLCGSDHVLFACTNHGGHLMFFERKSAWKWIDGCGCIPREEISFSDRIGVDFLDLCLSMHDSPPPPLPPHDESMK